MQIPIDWLIDWLFSSQEIKELRALYVYIYIFFL